MASVCSVFTSLSPQIFLEVMGEVKERRAGRWAGPLCTVGGLCVPANTCYTSDSQQTRLFLFQKSQIPIRSILCLSAIYMNLNLSNLSMYIFKKMYSYKEMKCCEKPNIYSTLLFHPKSFSQ